MGAKYKPKKGLHTQYVVTQQDKALGIKIECLIILAMELYDIVEFFMEVDKESAEQFEVYKERVNYFRVGLVGSDEDKDNYQNTVAAMSDFLHSRTAVTMTKFKVVNRAFLTFIDSYLVLMLKLYNGEIGKLQKGKLLKGNRKARSKQHRQIRQGMKERTLLLKQCLSRFSCPRNELTDEFVEFIRQHISEHDIKKRKE